MKDTKTPDALQPGDLVGPWRIEGYAGHGTYGAVYRAQRANHPGRRRSGSLSLLVGLVVLLHSPPEREPLPPYLATEREVEETFAADAGVGDLALSAVEPHRAVLPSILSLGRSMPSNPFPGQRKPPCEPRVERAINGACWIGPLEGQRPPCGAKMFDYEDRCYLASYDEARKPTSGEP